MKFRLIIIASFLLSFSLPSFGGWIDSKQQGNLVYFLYDSPAVIKRYDLNLEAFISDLTFGNSDATAFHVDSDGLYIAFNRNLSRYSLSGTNGISLGNSDATISEIIASSSAVYAAYSDNLMSIRKSDNTLIETKDFFYRMNGLSYSPLKGRLYARNVGISPSDILYINLPADGSFNNNHPDQTDSPYHGDYPNASETYLFPDEQRVVDNSGIIYTTDGLSYIGSFAGSFQDISFYENLPIILRDGELVSYSASNIETGSHAYPDQIDVKKIIVNNDQVFGFYESGFAQLSAIKTPIDDLDPDQPGEPINPIGLEYDPDHMIMGDDGVIYILSRSNMSVFRWSIQSQQYLSTIPLIGVPDYFAYSAENQALYFAYGMGKITKIALDDQFEETTFVNLPSPPLGLATAGQYIFAVDPSGAWFSHWTFSPNGELISQKEWNRSSKEFIWNSTNRRMYHFRDGTSPNDLHWEEIRNDGTLGDGGDSPYHSSTGIVYPIRVAPDGSAVVLGSGRVYDGITLSQVSSLSNNIYDAIWYQGKLFTLKADDTSTVLQEWDPSANYSLSDETSFSGPPIRLLNVSAFSKNWTIIVSEVANKPHFRVIENGSDNDYDNDSVNNDEDNCPYVSNPLQEDFDDNGIGDVCEEDTDGDGIKDDRDNCVTIRNPDQADGDQNGIGDACDVNYQNDGWLLMTMTSVLSAAKNQKPKSPPEWGVYNTICCPESAATLTLTIGGKRMRSTLPSCSSTEPTFEGFSVTEAGKQSVSGQLSAPMCGVINFNANATFAESTRYLFVGAVSNNQPVIQILTSEINDSAARRLDDPLNKGLELPLSSHSRSLNQGSEFRNKDNVSKPSFKLLEEK